MIAQVSDDPASTPLSNRQPEKHRWLLLLLIVGVGVYLRFHMLGVRGLWPAECFSVLLAWQPWGRFLRSLWWGEANMAFYYLLMRGWVLLGDSEVWVFSLSALFGVLAIPAVYLFGRRFLSTKIGLMAAALLAVHSSHIEHSEQVRCYSLWVLLAVLLTYCFLLLLESPQRTSLWLLYIFLAVLFIYTQVFGVFLIAAHWLPFIGRMKRLGIWKILATFVCIGVLSGPIAIVMATQDKGQLDWVPPLSLHGIWEVFKNIVGADVLRFEQRPLVVLLSLLYVSAWLFAFRGIFGSPKNSASESPIRTTTVVLAWSLAFPLAIMTGLSLHRPILYPRYLLMSVPAAVLLAGQGLSTIAQSLRRERLFLYAPLLAMLSLSVLGTHEFDSEIRGSGNDWRGVCNYILEHQQPGDAVIFYNFSGGWAFDYFKRRYHEMGGAASYDPPVLFPLKFEPASIVQRTAPYQRVWIVLQQTLPTPVSIENDKILLDTMEHGRFHLTEKVEYDGERVFPNEDVSIELSLYSAAPVAAANNTDSASTSSTANLALGSEPAYANNGAACSINDAPGQGENDPVDSYTCPLPNPTGAGNLLVVMLRWLKTSSPAVSFTDEVNNTYIQAATCADDASATATALYYVQNTKAGARNIAVHFSNPSGAVSMGEYEFYNVAQSTALDKASCTAAANSSTVASGALPALSASGDLVFQFGMADKPVMLAGCVPSPQPNIAWKQRTAMILDNQPQCAQYGIYNSKAPFSPSFVVNTGINYVSAAAAFKPARAGTPPPAGIRVNYIQHDNSIVENLTSALTAMPISGNLAVVMYTGSDDYPTAISDGANQWKTVGADHVCNEIITPPEKTREGECSSIWYASVANPGTYKLNFTRKTYNSAPGFGDSYTTFDISGAASSNVIDTGFGTNGLASATGRNTIGPFHTIQATPSARNELILVSLGQQWDTMTGLTSPAGSFFLANNYIKETNSSHADLNGGWGLLYNGPSTASEIWTWTHDTVQHPGVNTWTSAAAAFHSASQ